MVPFCERRKKCLCLPVTYSSVCLSIISHLFIISYLFTIYPLFITSLSSVYPSIYVSIAYQSLCLTVYLPSSHLLSITFHLFISISNVYILSNVSTECLLFNSCLDITHIFIFSIIYLSIIYLSAFLSLYLPSYNLLSISLHLFVSVTYVFANNNLSVTVCLFTSCLVIIHRFISLSSIHQSLCLSIIFQFCGAGDETESLLHAL